MSDKARTEEAVRRFAVVSWIRGHTKIYDVSGDNFYADCPICHGVKRLGISRERKIFHCFRCNEGGHGGGLWTGRTGLIGMVMLLEKLKYEEAVAFILKSTGIEDIPTVRKARISSATIELPKERHDLKALPEEHRAIQYMNSRGMQHLVPYSWFCVSGRYADRVILPGMYFDKFVGFEAKTLYKTILPKSLFPTWFNTSEWFYTSFDWKFERGVMVITESIFDAETVGRNAIGIYGSTLHEGQMARMIELASKGIKKIVWMLDSDAWKKQTRAVFQLSAFFETYAMSLPMPHDPNSLGRDWIYANIQNARRIRNELDMFDIYK